jgi:hypothetical protein
MLPLCAKAFSFNTLQIVKLLMLLTGCKSLHTFGEIFAKFKKIYADAGMT